MLLAAVPRVVRFGWRLIVATLALCSGSGLTAPARAAARPIVTRDALAGYITRVADSWEAYTTPDGRVDDPLDPSDSGDNYGVIMLADVMLKTGAQTRDPALARTGERIVEKATSMQAVTGPFSLLAVTALLRDGQRGLFPAGIWAQIAPAVAALAARVGPSTQGCFTTPGCFNNWRLVWSAGAAALAASQVGGAANADTRALAGEISSDLALAVTHAGAPARPSVLSGARELSDPGSEPPSYHVFSCALLELIAEADPTAMTPALQRLRQQAAGYALQLMAPDGQMSFTGRSLDQSWVQAAADLGVRQAAIDPARAGQWRSFADRATSYLLTAYPRRPDGLIPIVPGLALSWSPSIIDSYAAFDQYEGLTLWFLSDALQHSSQADTTRTPLPADETEFLVGDLHSSGLVWGRSGAVWWALSGRATSRDPRFAQGLVAVTVHTPSGWRNLLALRPRRGGSSAWTLTLPGGHTAVPVFTAVRGNGHHTVLVGNYRAASGQKIAPVTWTLTTTTDGVSLAMTRPARAQLRTTVWLVNGEPHLSFRTSHADRGSCTVTASGRACPTTVRWAPGASALLGIEL
jgi:hypothetical protein